ncbi:tyrosine-type recombinase/integrase [Bradyrhizobium sp. AZCC 1708]
MMKRLVLQVGPDEMCSDLGYDEFKRVRTELRTCNRGRPTKRKGKYAPKTINNYLELMLTILREAERKLTTSFARRPTRKEMVKLKEKVVQRSRHFSEAEEKKMEAFSDPDLKDMWKFDLLTGIRADELCGVRWDKINWSRNRVSVEVKATGMDPYWREIECIPEAMKILYRRKRLGYHDEFVFTLPLDRDGWLDEKRRRRGDQILVSSRLFYTRMCAIWKKASIPDAIVHDLRRTAGRRIYDEHKDIEAARVFLGHGDWRETARYLGLKPRDVVPTARRASARSTANLAEIDAAMGEVPRQPVPTSNAARSAALRIVGQEIAAQINAGRN